jgi:hypothetical protein
MSNRQLLAYFGHHRSASTLMLKIINEACDYAGLRHAHFHSPKMWGYKDGFTLDKASRERRLDFVSYISADLNYLGDLASFRAVHLIRDPRDIAISAYFAHRNSHPTEGWPELVQFRAVLERLHRDEGILENIKFTAQLPIDGWNVNLFDTMKEWNYKADNVMEVRFEDFVKDPYQFIMEMFEFLGLISSSEPQNSVFLREVFQNWLPRWVIESQPIRSIPPGVLLTIIYRNRFAKLAGGRQRGEADEKSHYRKGTPGDWRNYFNEQHKQYFKEHYNDLLVRLGYENGYDW